MNKLMIMMLCFFVMNTTASVQEEQSIDQSKNTSVQKACIGIINISGEINKDTAKSVIRTCIEFSENIQVKGVLLIIHSAGGISGIGELIYREIKELSFAKPVVTLVVGFCLSAGYAIAIGSDWIVAPMRSEIGSIGTYHLVKKFTNSRIKGNDIEADVEFEFFYAGKFKVCDAPESGPLTGEERQCLQENVNKLYDSFCYLVAQNRGLSFNARSEWADGKVFTGQEALHLGLIDQVGGFSDAIRKLKEFMQQRGIDITQKFAFIE